jgi:putative ABC transport system permease protein
MILYELRLAAHAFKRSWLLTSVIVGALAVGIGVTMVTVTLYHTMSAHPIREKENSLFAVTLDSKSDDPALNRFDRYPGYPPFQLTYADAQALFRSEIPQRKVMMYKSERVLDAQDSATRPFRATVRLTTADFFSIFNVPVRYGASWNRTADEGPESVAVISRRANERIFGGINSVGRTITVDGRAFRVVGVMDEWLPRPKFYDLNNGAFDLPEDVYLPFQWGEALQLMTTGNMSCMRADISVKSFADLTHAECAWLQFWAELPDADRQSRFQQFIDSYVLEQKRVGRFPRPLNNQVIPVSRWLQMNDVVVPQVRTIIILAALFLVVCVLNAIGILLAKFMAAAPVSAIRRALGATRVDVFRMHLTELVLIGLLGGVGGVLLSAVGLMGLRRLLIESFLPQADRIDSSRLLDDLTQLDLTMIAVALGLAVLAGLAAGLYPAWRVCKTSPTAYLKAQ